MNPTTKGQNTTNKPLGISLALQTGHSCKRIQIESSTTDIQYSVVIHTCSLSTFIYLKTSAQTSVLCSAFTLTFKSISSRSTLGTLDKSVTCRRLERALRDHDRLPFKILTKLCGLQSGKVWSKRFKANCSLTNQCCKVTISYTKMASGTIRYVTQK